MSKPDCAPDEPADQTHGIAQAPPDTSDFEAKSNAALFQFTDALYRSRSLGDAVDASLDAITGAFGCRRASVLLFDSEGVARFAGWRGLSPEYRAAVEGHSPWVAGARDAEPILVSDIRLSGETEALKATISTEGIVGLAFVPIMANGGVVGKFMTYHDAPHHYTQAERTLALTIARQFGFSIERRLAEEERDAAEDALRAREELRQSEERFRILVEGVTDYAIYMINEHGDVTNWNAGARRIKGYQDHEIIGRHFSQFYTEEDRQNDEPARALHTARTEGRYEKEGWRVRMDGTRFWAHVVIDPIRNSDGDVIGFAKVTRDITERRDAQRALERAREAFFQSQKMEAIGQLTGGIAHDFNNLLAAVLGSLELLRKRLPDDARTMRLVDNAMQAARRGAALTQRMLAFARRQDLKIEPTNVAALVEGMTDLLQRTLGPTIELDVDCDWALPRALADFNQLELAILNLAVNARDAMPQGGVIRIAARERALPDATPGERCVCLSVSDNGEGMDAVTLERATEPFFTTKGVGKGTGLGLSMVQGFLAQLGGRLVLHSESGKGTTVELCLPVATGDSGERPESERNVAPAPAGRSLRILAVDDDALVLMNTVGLLEDLGHTVFEASSAAAALKLLEREEIDLLLTDQAMPRMTGLELAQRVREAFPAMPVVIATGYAELPANPALPLLRLAKPFAQHDLRRILAEAVK